MLNATATCSAAHCESLAESACDHCGKPYCGDHLQPVTLTRRDDSETSRHWNLSRMPSVSTTYRLCPLCKKKPFSGRLFPVNGA